MDKAKQIELRNQHAMDQNAEDLFCFIMNIGKGAAWGVLQHLQSEIRLGGPSSSTSEERRDQLIKQLAAMKLYEFIVKAGWPV